MRSFGTPEGTFSSAEAESSTLFHGQFMITKGFRSGETINPSGSWKPGPWLTVERLLPRDFGGEEGA